MYNLRKIINGTLILAIFSFPSAFAQQVNNFPVCTNYQEVYIPGGYDAFGNYIQGGIVTQRNNYNCSTGYNHYNGYNGYNRYNGYNSRYNYCSPTRTLLGGVLGGSIGAALTRNSRNRNWAIPLGAAIGGLSYSC